MSYFVVQIFQNWIEWMKYNLDFAIAIDTALTNSETSNKKCYLNSIAQFRYSYCFQ